MRCGAMAAGLADDKECNQCHDAYQGEEHVAQTQGAEIFLYFRRAGLENQESTRRRDGGMIQVVISPLQDDDGNSQKLDERHEHHPDFGRGILA